MPTHIKKTLHRWPLAIVLLSLLFSCSTIHQIQAFTITPPLLSSSSSLPLPLPLRHQRTTLNSSPKPPSNFRKTVDILSLQSIRSTLIRQEETIIFAMIERAHFAQNNIVYESKVRSTSSIPDLRCGLLGPNTPPLPIGAVRPAKYNDKPFSFMSYMLLGTEVLHSSVRRYTSPEEHAFFPSYLPPPLVDLPVLNYPSTLLSNLNKANEVSVNTDLLNRYINEVIPQICGAGDDEQHGSSVLCDITVLQAMSKRIHYGKFVAESKYRANPDKYNAMVAAGDREGVYNELTDLAVEEKVLKRALMKCATYGREPLLNDISVYGVASGLKGGRYEEVTAVVVAAAAAAAVAAVQSMDFEVGEGGMMSNGQKVNPKAIERIYKDLIIPLTKIIEVEYLRRRCGGWGGVMEEGEDEDKIRM